MASPVRALSSRTPVASVALGMTLAASACSPAPQRCPPPAAFPYPVAAPPGAAAAPVSGEGPREREKVAVLPIEDDHLFRAERAALRALLVGDLARRAPEWTMVPLAEVDAALRPVSAKTGARCAFEDGSLERRAQDRGWLTTDLLHVANGEGRPEELWVDVGRKGSDAVTFTGVWDARLDPVARYRAAFDTLRRTTDAGGLLGGLVGTPTDATAAHAGPMTLCEEKPFAACEPRSAAWTDRLAELASCYVGEDDVENELLVEATPQGTRCELTDVDDLTGRDGKREPCLCRVLATSAGVRAAPGRRVIRVHYEAPDLQGKPRPEVRAIDVTTNVAADEDWHSMRSGPEGKPVYTSVHRLAIENLDDLAAPLARCAAPPGAVVVAELAIAENGAVTGGHVVTAPSDAPRACIEQALARGALGCTSDGKPATLRVALTWPR